MSTNETDTHESIASRTERALTEPLTVVTLDGTPVQNAEQTIVSVVSHSGETYDVDTRAGRCTCPDARHRDPDGGCKHVRRARFALGKVTLPAEVVRQLGENIDDTIGANAPGPCVTASDGGIVGGDGAELVDDDAPATWKGPFAEYDKYGEPTGARYVRCTGCEVEVLAGDTRHATHRDGCDGPEE